MDFTALTAAVDLDTAVTAILAVAAVLVLPKIAKAGARAVMSMIR